MKLWKRLTICLVALLVSFGAFAFAGRADFGDYGGDSDYGDSDYGDSDSDYDYDSDYDDDGYGYGVGGVSGKDLLLVLIIGGILFAVAFNKGKKAKQAQQGYVPGAAETDPSTLRPAEEYRQVDPQFDDAAFREKLANLYVQMQQAWEAKDLTPLQPYLSGAFYAQADRQLDRYRQNKQTNHMERITVLDVSLTGWKQENGHDIMIAQLRTRLVDYVTDDTTGKLVRGSRTAEKFMRYEWQLERTTGVLTGVSAGTSACNCPNCGAALDINRSVRCPYCDSVLTDSTFDWVVSGIKGLAQKTVGG